jgi:hypothetical protein
MNRYGPKAWRVGHVASGSDEYAVIQYLELEYDTGLTTQGNHGMDMGHSVDIMPCHLLLGT